MLVREQAQRLLELALIEFAAEWESSGECVELSLYSPEHWPSGVGTFGFILRHRTTGAVKLLGRRRSDLPGTTCHRGISYRVLEAYADRNTDPMRRYLQEIDVLTAARVVARPFAPEPGRT